ncbi:hypothetical protein FD28_GL002515 [Levilactobacillus hammesii DSM 16381]|uniref:DUF1351 domain-containing protein n=2 Tax=Levilactobacillus hammesii TaxID=267633 RepID=A0A0R1UQS8_9LACO|nr:hypothetical protein FD28_GL002515 [Levilactobacillus hammesii DSM 16381]
MIIEPAVDVHPSPITIKNLDQVQQAVSAIVAKYGQDFIVTADNIKDTKAMRASLNKVSKAVDEKRLAVKRQYAEPVKIFDKQMGAFKDQIDGVISPLDVKIKEVIAQERAAKQERVEGLIAEMAPNYGVSADAIEIEPSWLNKSATKKQIVDGIAGAMTVTKKAADQLAADTEAITKYAEVQGVDAAGWVDQVKQGQDVDYLMKAIDNQVERQAEKQRKLEAKAAEERTHQQTKGNTVVDTNTGEVVSRTVVLKIMATRSQMILLKNFMDANSIKYEREKKYENSTRN